MPVLHVLFEVSITQKREEVRHFFENKSNFFGRSFLGLMLSEFCLVLTKF